MEAVGDLLRMIGFTAFAVLCPLSCLAPAFFIIGLGHHLGKERREERARARQRR